MPATFSIYNLLVDRFLSFTPGPTAGWVLSINSDGSTKWVPQTSGLTNSFYLNLGSATNSGSPDWSTGFFTSWNSNYSTGAALDDISAVIKKLAPPTAPSLGSLSSMVLSSYYPAPNSGSILISANGTVISNSLITDSTSTIVQLSNMSTNPGAGATNASGGFAIEPASTLTAFINGVSYGAIYFTDQTLNIGTYSNNRLIVTEYDYWNNVSGKSNFWPALVAQVATAMSGIPYGTASVKLSWETGGSYQNLNMVYDNPVTPTISGLTISTTAAGNRYVSGVPSMTTGDILILNATIDNFVSKVYRTVPWMVTSTSVVTSSSNPVLSGARSGAIGLTTSGTINTNQYTENITLTSTVYNGKSVSANGTLQISNSNPGKTMRVDTVSNESPRLYSGGTSSDYPISGYGTSFSATQSLITSGYLYELQMLNGLYKRITGNYVNNYPIAGPDYSTDSNTNYRWVTFQKSVSAISSYTITFNGSSGFVADGSNQTTGIKILAKVETLTKWVNSNSAYSGVGNPGSGASDGDSNMVVANSTATIKVCTFGTANYTGTLYVRIGLPSGSALYFSSITIS